MSDDMDDRAQDAFQSILASVADSSSLTSAQRIAIGEELGAISKFVEIVWEMMDKDVLFSPSGSQALHAIADCAGEIRMMLASAIIQQNPGSLHMAMRIRENEMKGGQ